MNALLAGYVYELLGIAYYAITTVMSLRRGSTMSRRSRALAVLASLALVGSGVFGYARSPVAGLVMALLLALSLVSIARDRATGSGRRPR